MGKVPGSRREVGSEASRTSSKLLHIAWSAASAALHCCRCRYSALLLLGAVSKGLPWCPNPAPLLQHPA